MSINWKAAPDGATHWDASDCRVNSWMKLEDGYWFYWPPASLEPTWCGWAKEGKQDVSCMIARPRIWSGPEDGLPPVGTVCEFNDSCGGQWHKVEIMYASKHTILIKFFGGELEDVEGAYSPEETICFRAIPAPAQLRETAIRELMDIAQVDCRVTAARLVDAGFRR